MPASYFAPRDLDEALALLESPDAAILAGGTDVFAAKGRAPLKRDIVDITRIEALRAISREGGTLRIGAGCTWTDILRADLPGAFRALKEAARAVGGVQIQNSATLAGNLCNASPAADGVPPLLILDAQVEIAGRSGRRSMALEAFLTGPRRTALGRGELVTALLVPPQPDHAGSAFEKLGARRYLVISIAMTAALIGCDDTGRIDVARIATGACSPVARRLTALETALIGTRPGALEITRDLLAPLAPISDIRADAAYRDHAVPHQITRAIRRAARG